MGCTAVVHVCRIVAYHNPNYTHLFNSMYTLYDVHTQFMSIVTTKINISLPHAYQVTTVNERKYLTATLFLVV